MGPFVFFCFCTLWQDVHGVLKKPSTPVHNDKKLFISCDSLFIFSLSHGIVGLNSSFSKHKPTKINILHMIANNQKQFIWVQI